MSDFVDLSQFEEEFVEAPAEREMDNVPDGKYQVCVDKIELANSHKSGTPMLKWQLKIIAPNNIGRMIFRNNILKNGDNIKWLKQDLFTCGLELTKLSDLPNRLQELLDVTLEVTVKTKGEYSNTYINRRLSVNEAPAASEDVDMLLF